MITRRAALAGAAVIAASGGARAQAFPSKPLRFLIPYPAGGIVDVVGRTLGEKLAGLLGEQVVIDNRPGGNAAIATDIVAKAPADGHTWLLATVGHVVTPHLQKVEYDPIGDFAGAAYLCNVPAIAVVPASSTFKSMAEIVARAKAEPGKLTYLSPGVGTSMHLNMELMRVRTGAAVAGVPYRGIPPGMTDLLEGRLDFGLLPPVLATAHIRAGKLRPLAVAASQRLKSVPDVPTFAEAGLADSVVESWYATLVPARTPKDVITRIHAATVEALKDAQVQAKLEAAGALLPPKPLSPAEVDALLKRELPRYGELVKAAGIKTGG
ncbi:MAG: tripartite tricarboxylate transporter substrate binding protein [Alphaproteobacteria bacterium]|nr:tripartite tricarboxylate transporter substrate binding protein [Alphaproteobacteria bacterium]MCW5741196.1 tripartite tricarboxylate transporter substrate binding protein [Alphaproteobacteria bacterium]